MKVSWGELVGCTSRTGSKEPMQVKPSSSDELADADR